MAGDAGGGRVRGWRGRRARRTAAVVTTWLVLCAALIAREGVARAQSADDPKDQARVLFLAGQQAFEAGRLDVAQASFEAAYRINPLPALLFNLGQVHYKQFLLSGAIEPLRRAVAEYREYLDKEPNGRRRSEAFAALTELTPLLARLAPAPAASPPPTPVPVEIVTPTQLMIVSDAANAQVRLDDNAPAPAPLLQEVKAGPHRAIVEAPGYFPRQMELLAVERRLVVSEARLIDKPGRLLVEGAAGAQLHVDGKPVALLPLPAPLEVSQGSHFIAVTRRGSDPWAETVRLERDTTLPVRPSLRASSQRRAATWVAMTAAALALGVAGGGAVWGEAEQSALRSKEAREATGGQSTIEAMQYEDARSRRDASRTATLTLVGFTSAAALLAAGLFLFDTPAAPAPPLNLTSQVDSVGGGPK